MSVLFETPGVMLSRMYELHLHSLGVKLPKKGQLRNALEYLVLHMGESKHIDEIKDHVSQTHTLTGTDPLQIRHLSTQMGFYIEKEGRYKHKLVTLETCMPGFIRDKRGTMLTADLWETIKQEYSYNGRCCCVNCGSREHESLRWKLTEKTQIQQGHMDPRKPLSYNNVIPQCQFCNQRYKDKYVFDKRGQTIRLL